MAGQDFDCEASWLVCGCLLSGTIFFFLDQNYSSMSLTLPPNVSFCDPENAVVNWCFDQDKESGNRPLMFCGM